jgi:hypothetical protein
MRRISLLVSQIRLERAEVSGFRRAAPGAPADAMPCGLSSGLDVLEPNTVQRVEPENWLPLGLLIELLPESLDLIGF